MIGIFRTSTYPRDGLIFGNRIASLLLLKLPSSLHRPSATTFSVPSFYDRHTLFNTLIYSTKLHSNIASLRNILYISGDRLFQFSSQRKKMIAWFLREGVPHCQHQILMIIIINNNNIKQ